MKVHKKVYGIAKLYYDIEDYNAAITALNNVLTDYPTIDNQSEIQFLPLGDLKSGGSIVLNSKTITIEPITGKWSVN